MEFDSSKQFKHFGTQIVKYDICMVLYLCNVVPNHEWPHIYSGNFLLQHGLDGAHAQRIATRVSCRGEFGVKLSGNLTAVYTSSLWKPYFWFPKSDAISNSPCSLNRNITLDHMKNLTFHSLLRWKMIILPILTTPLIHFSLEVLGNVRTFWASEWKD